MKRTAFLPLSGFALVLSILLLAGAQVASAFQPADQNAWLEVPLRHFDLAGYRGAEVEQGSALSAASVTARYGGEWRVHSWNPQTRTASALFGSGIDLAPAGASDSALESVARQVVATNPEVFGADNDQLRLATVTSGLGKRTVHLQQTYQGMDVWGGRVRLTFNDAGRLFVMGGEYYDGIALDPRPSISLEAAEAIARRDLPFNPLTDEVEEGAQLLVLPEPLSETSVAHHLVWRVRVHTQEPVGIWVTHVDAHSGEIVWRYNDVHFLDLEGSAETHVQPGTWCNDQVTKPSPYMRVAAAGYPTTYTDAAGDFAVPAGSNPVNVTVDFYGPYARVWNQAGAEAALTQSVTPGTPLPFVFTDRNSQNDERDVFRAVQDIHNFFETFAPGFYLTNQRMICYVSINNTCNAYYNGNINFFQAGDGCANTGEIQGVVYHEYGHGVQQQILGWQGDEGLGEGNSDILANLLTQEAIIGRGFYTFDCDGGLRTSENTLIYPDHVDGYGIHDAGRVIAGFHWDLMVLLQEHYGVEQGTLLAAQLWHYGRVLQHPTIQPAQVLATFIADDDDGNLYNGTPHFDLICQAAQNHNFSCPAISEGVFIAHTPPASFTAPQEAEILATISSTEAALDADELSLHYRVNDGAWQEAPLTTTGQPDEYHATLSGLELPSEVEYYLSAADLLGNERAEPSLAPAVLHSFDFGWVYDPFEAESGWTVNLEGTDTATTGQWVLADPVGTIAQPENDHTPGAGVQCWVTGNGEPGGPAGAADVDDGVTSLYSPIYNLSGAPIAEVKYWRWYSNNKGNEPHTQDWVVQVRNNGGAWVDIERAEDEQNRWVSREADLLALFGGGLGSVQFRFVAEDATNSLIEAALDEFVIRAVVDASAAPGVVGDAPRFAFLGGRGNPIVGPTEIAFQLPERMPVRLGLFDVSGRLVRALADEELAAGAHSLTWDGKDANGQSVPSGIYYCRLQAPGFDATQRLVLQR